MNINETEESVNRDWGFQIRQTSDYSDFVDLDGVFRASV